MKNKNRWFIVYFIANDFKYNINGNLNIESENGCYPSRDFCLENIFINLSKCHSEIKKDKIAINNIIELTESDYKDWIS